MLEATMKKSGSRHALTLRGHAAYNPGCDIVCAAASALVCALAQYLCSAEDHVETVDRLRLESGQADIVCVGDAFVSCAFEVAAQGLTQLAKTYPAHVSFSREGDAP